MIVNDSGISVIIEASRLPTPNRAVLKKRFFVGRNKGKTGRTITVGELNNGLVFVTGLKGSMLNQRSINCFGGRKVSAECVTLSRSSTSKMTLVDISSRTRGDVMITSNTGVLLGRRSISGVLRRVYRKSVLLVRLRVPLRAIRCTTEGTFKGKIGIILGPTPTHDLPGRLFQRLCVIAPGHVRTRVLANVGVTGSTSIRGITRRVYTVKMGGMVVALNSGKYLVERRNISCHVSTFGIRPISAATTKSAFGKTLYMKLSRNVSLGRTTIVTSGTSSVTMAEVKTRSSVPCHRRLWSLGAVLGVAVVFVIRDCKLTMTLY